VGYLDITEGARAKFCCSVGYMDITEGYRAMLGRPVRYMDMTRVPVPLHVPHILPGPLREVLVILCAPDGVPEHLKDVHLLFLDLTKTGKNVHFGSFFEEVVIHYLISKKKKFIHKKLPSFLFHLPPVPFL
jgi:hypothetical protein